MEKSALFETVDSEAASLRELAREVWNTPEVALQEYESSETLQNALREEGFEVEAGVAGIETAFVARYGDGDPVVGTIGEFDALPGMSQQATAERTPIEDGAPGHGCGHNLFGVASLGGAVAVKRAIEAGDLDGTVVYYGTPAEEAGGGKMYMVREGVFDEAEAVISWHPGWYNAPSKGSCLAVDAFSLSYEGETSHAAASPESGRSALDAVQLASSGIEYMREHVPDEARIHYVITEGGGAPNVVPAEASMEVLVRSPERDEVERISDWVRDIADSAATMTQTESEVTKISGLYDLLPNYTLADAIGENMAAAEFDLTDDQMAFAEELKATLDSPSFSRVPEEHREKAAESAMFTEPLEAFDEGQSFPGSTDEGDVSWVVPMGRFQAATWPAGTPAHSWQAVAAGEDLGTAGMLFASKVIAGTLADLLADADLRAEARAEFESRTSEEGYECPMPEDADPYELINR
jgi:aminobenzoyl-glutamate utilization protein B